MAREPDACGLTAVDWPITTCSRHAAWESSSGGRSRGATWRRTVRPGRPQVGPICSLPSSEGACARNSTRRTYPPAAFAAAAHIVIRTARGRSTSSSGRAVPLPRAAQPLLRICPPERNGSQARAKGPGWVMPIGRCRPPLWKPKRGRARKERAARPSATHSGRVSPYPAPFTWGRPVFWAGFENEGSSPTLLVAIHMWRRPEAPCARE